MQKNIELRIRMVGKTKEDIAEILESVADLIRSQSKGRSEGIDGFETDKGAEVGFNWNFDETEDGDIYGNPIEEQAP